jgi:hypothetical protein
MESLTIAAIFEMVGKTFSELPDRRTGKNRTYAMADAAAGAFGVFFTQSPSFLAYQRDMERNKGQHNAASLFGVTQIPSDQQIRNLLDEVEPSNLYEPFWTLQEQMEEAGYLADHRGHQESYLVALDGTCYFSSQTIHCDNCTVHQHGDRLHYYHSAVTPVLVTPGKNRVYPLEPEFILPQDGSEKQDCERNAAKRWVERCASRFEPWQATLLTDDLHCHQPFCTLLLENELNFILVCKPDSHPTLYEEIALLERVGGIESVTTRCWNGRFTEQRHYRYANQVPLRAGADPLLVNWCEVTIHRTDTGERIYYNTFATNFALTDESVASVVRSGRARWKTENESNNVLKNYGYNLEHNYGHGEKYLSAVLVTLNLLAFLIHTVLDQTNSVYAAIRQELGTRKTFFDDIRALTRYFYFKDWDTLLTFMATQLEIQLEPD